MGTASDSPLFQPKDRDQPSVFQVDSLIREARRQRGLLTVPVPDVCLLDPDGDTIRHLKIAGRAVRFRAFLVLRQRGHLPVRLPAPEVARL